MSNQSNNKVVVRHNNTSVDVQGDMADIVAGSLAFMFVCIGVAALLKK